METTKIALREVFEREIDEYDYEFGDFSVFCFKIVRTHDLNVLSRSLFIGPRGVQFGRKITVDN